MDQVVAGFREPFVTVSSLGHLLSTGFMDSGIRPLVEGKKVVGPAVTVSMPTPDSTANRMAVDRAAPGDIIVVNCGNDREFARWGELICFDAQYKGVEALVIDGGISASGPIRQMGFQVYNRFATGLVGRRLGAPGVVEVPVVCGGVLVSPGDLVVGDDDGVVVIPSGDAEHVLEECRSRYGSGRKEAARRWIMSGRPYSSYPGPGWEERDDLPTPVRRVTLEA